MPFGTARRWDPPSTWAGRNPPGGRPFRQGSKPCPGTTAAPGRGQFLSAKVVQSPGLVKDEHRSIRNNARLAGAFLESDVSHLRFLAATMSQKSSVSGTPIKGISTMSGIAHFDGH